MLIEWPERVGSLLPPHGLWVRLRWVDESRRALQLDGHGARSEALLREFRKAAFGG